MVVALFRHGLDHQKMKRQFIQVTQAVQSKYYLSVILTLTQQQYTSKCMRTPLAEVFFVMHHQSKERNPLIHVGAKLHIIVLHHAYILLYTVPSTYTTNPTTSTTEDEDTPDLIVEDPTVRNKFQCGAALGMYRRTLWIIVLIVFSITVSL